MSLLPAILAAVGMNQAGNAQRSANNLNNRAVALQEDAYYTFQKPQAEAMMRISKMLMENLQKQVDAGVFDFDTIQKNMKVDMDFIRAQTMKDIQATTEQMGYRPGDTVATDAIARGNREITEDFTRKSTDLRMKLPSIMASAFGAAMQPGSVAANSIGNWTNGISNTLQNQAAIKANQAGNPAGIVQAFMPFLPGNSPVAGGSSLTSLSQSIQDQAKKQNFDLLNMPGGYGNAA